MNDEQPTGHEPQSPASKEHDKRFGRGRDLVVHFVVGVIAGAAIYFLLISPPSGRAPQLAREAICGTNLYGISKGIALFEAEHGDKTPPDLATAVLSAGLPSSALICPLAGRGHAAATTQPADLSEHCDYVYVTGQDGAVSDGGNVMVFDLPANHEQRGMNVLFLAGNVK